MERPHKKNVFLSSPQQLFLRVLAIVLVAEMALISLLILFYPEEHGLFISIANATMLVLLSAPFLWYFVVHPLRCTALAEHLQAGLIESFNPAAERMFGYKPEEVLGKPLTHLIPKRYRDAHQQGLSRNQSTSEFRLTGKTLELHGLRGGGSEFPLELSFSAWKTGTEAHYAGIMREITERKQTESALAEKKSKIQLLQEVAKSVERGQ